MNVPKKRTTKIVLGVVLVLVAIRIALPFIVLRYANRTLEENIPGYTGHIEDVDLALYRGAYRIDAMVIEKVTNDLTEPFLFVPGIDFSVEWKSIFKGAITGEVVVESPEIVFGFGGGTAQAQTGEEIDWVTLVTDLMPITINRFTIRDGTAKLLNAWAEPRVDVEVADVEFDIHNIRNVTEAAEALPSPFVATANFPGYGGSFHMNGDAQLVKLIPDFNYDAQLKNFDLVKANDLVKYYAGLDFEKGTAGIYSELAMSDGRFKGYVKPLLNDVQIFSRDEEDRSVGQYFAELFAEGAQELLENHRKDQIATRIPIEGDLNSPETDVWTAIIAVLRNAYWDAFRPQLDATIDFTDAASAGSDDEKKGVFRRIFGGGEDLDDGRERANDPELSEVERRREERKAERAREKAAEEKAEAQKRNGED